MPSENQKAQMAAARTLSMKNNSCYPCDDIKMPEMNSKEPGSMEVDKVNDGEMYGR